ncbi:MAG TPA: carbon-nitrogen hydrolase family protein [Labilithrix sp.]|jgi:predicted amidohydrolase
MRVTVLELPARWGEPAAALADVEAVLARGPETDLVVLPEMALTGYVSAAGDFDLRPFAEATDGPTASAASALAARRHVNLLAPLVLKEGDRFYNAVALFGRGGERLATYRKRHPWFPETWASAGPEAPPVVEIEGVLVTIAICFDVHFLEADTARELARSELLLFPSAWVDPEDTRVELLAELAQKFDLHVAAANWAPGVVRLPGQGGSCVLAPSGTVLAAVAPGESRADADLRT